MGVTVSDPSWIATSGSARGKAQPAGGQRQPYLPAVHLRFPVRLNAPALRADGGSGGMMLAVVHIHKTAGTTLSGVLKHADGGTDCDVRAEDREAPFFSAAD